MKINATSKPSKDQYTRYERARIVGARALQISMGAPVLARDVKTVEPIDVALAELEQGLIPITVRKINKSARREAATST
ncbi:MAG: DNA-directed RNA polymerase subunit K [Methanocella sp. PtaU1.Bin125]|nr:MAG: DNA-directed RNA polymerase subunit K [Methanocella sp. PtaU1.Bin125]